MLRLSQVLGPKKPLASGIRELGLWWVGQIREEGADASLPESPVPLNEGICLKL